MAGGVVDAGSGLVRFGFLIFDHDLSDGGDPSRANLREVKESDGRFARTGSGRRAILPGGTVHR
jgi:hypothetical protein